jgi:hypothetical protein
MVEGIFIMERNGKVQKHDRNKDIINAWYRKIYGGI